MTEKKKSQKQDKKQSKPKTTSKSKDAKLKAELKKAKQSIADLNDRLLRIAAESENIRKRKDREIARIIQTATNDLIKNILPVIDDIERSLKSSDNDSGEENLKQGVEMILQKLMSSLKNFGLEPMDSIGQEFDVDHHEALLQVDAKDVQPEIVVEVHEKGYFLNGHILRHAKVVISR